MHETVRNMLGLRTYGSGPYPFTGIRINSKCKASFVGHQQQIGISAITPFFLHESTCLAEAIIGYMTHAASSTLAQKYAVICLCHNLLCTELFKCMPYVLTLA